MLGTDEERVARIRIIAAESAAKDERRRALSSDERLQVDGDALRQQIKADPEVFVALERNAFRRVWCHARDDCAYLQVDAAYRGTTIRELFRICVHGVENMEWSGPSKHYYHVKCFMLMMDLTKLLPEKFKLDSVYGGWGIIVEKWVEHRGRIDLDKIAKFLEDWDEFEAMDAESFGWCLAHADNCKEKMTECRCPSSLDPPRVPELGDCTTEDGSVCPLSEVLEHRVAMKEIPEFRNDD